MKFEERKYQTEIVDALYNDIINGDDCNPVAGAPTGSGKTAILCRLIDRLLSNHSTIKILVLSHVAEILKQDYEALCDYFIHVQVGLYSSGLNSRTQGTITVAGIQSIHNKPEEFEGYDIAIIDEAHLVPVKGTGMYRSFIDELDIICVGLTATPYRLGHGYIHKGEGAIFNKMSIDYTDYENFNSLISKGYLSKVITKKTLEEMDTNGIGTVGDDFNVKQLAEKFDTDEKTIKICKEIVQYGKNYKKWLVFAINTKHADNIASVLRHLGINAKSVHSKMNGSKLEVIDELRSGAIRCAVSVEMLTTGVDVPDIDLIAGARPTKSPSRHVQMVGRGTRYFPGKEHCLFLDFAGNTERLGPINAIIIREKKKGNGTGEPITKTCPECGVIHHPSVRVCDVCDHVFEFKNNLTETADDADIIKQTKTIMPSEWYDVERVEYNIHSKRGHPSSLKVTYYCGKYFTFSEWICPDHQGWAKAKADNWTRHRWFSKNPQPANLRELYKYHSLLAVPKKIKVDINDRFPKVLDSIF